MIVRDLFFIRKMLLRYHEARSIIIKYLHYVRLKSNTYQVVSFLRCYSRLRKPFLVSVILCS